MRNRWLAGFSALLMALGLGALMSAPAAQAGTEWGSVGTRTAQVQARTIKAPHTKPVYGVDKNARSFGPLAASYHYSVSGQELYTTATNGADGVSVDTSQHLPYREPVGNNHTLFEIAVSGTSNVVGGTPGYGDNNTIELGWGAEPALCGSGYVHPCLWTAAWVNGTWLGHGRNGYVDNPSEAVNAAIIPNPGTSCTIAPNVCGTALAHTAGGAAPVNFYTYKIIRQATNSWNGAAAPGWRLIQKGVGQADRVIGMWPDTIFTSQGQSLPKIQFMQAFWEVYDNTKSNPCTDMGSGLFSAAGSARVNGYNLFTPPAGVTAAFNASFSGVIPAADTPTAYRYTSLTSTTFYGGGIGWNAAGTGAGTGGSC